MKNFSKAYPLRYLHEPCRKCGAAAGENCKHSNSKENDAKPDEQAADGLEKA